ncbi:hypothetical protein CFB41_09140 [Burkholderia sp. AU33803]|nr:hypothetical protein CFB41_09140 [Burkholderia sp. AU33803]PRD90142.1 hypothetical protein C6P88_23195 [Burkholderia contaminans]
MLPAAFRDGYPRQVRCGRLLLQVTGVDADAPVPIIAKRGIGASAEGANAGRPRSMGSAQALKG